MTTNVKPSKSLVDFGNDEVLSRAHFIDCEAVNLKRCYESLESLFLNIPLERRSRVDGTFKIRIDMKNSGY